MLEKISDPIGLTGVFIILVAYFLLSVGKWSAYSIKYQLINFFGAWLILFSLFFHWNLSSVIIEIAWAIISLIGIFRIINNKQQKKCNSAEP